MTTLLDRPTAIGPALGSAVSAAARTHAFLDDLDVMLDEISTGQLTAEVASWERVARRVEAIKLRLLARADTVGVAEASGMSGTDAWLARATKSGRGDAARQVRLATALEEGLATTAEALSRGLLSTAHAGVIADATSKLPVQVTRAERVRIEQALIAKAAEVNPADLRRAARRCLDAITTDQDRVDEQENGLLEDEETQARARTELSMWDNADGTVSGRFTVPHLAGAILRKTIEQMTSPRRAALGATRAQSGPVGYDGESLATRAGAAFVELLEHLPTDRLHPRTAATIVVTIDETHLRHRVTAAGLDTGDKLSAGEARRIACGAGILPVVLNGKTLVIDVGTSKRLFTETQRLALGLSHTTCAADGCERPFSWCEIHHQIPWQQGGRTDLANASPLCGFHHQRIHDRTYLHRISASGAVTFHQRR